MGFNEFAAQLSGIILIALTGQMNYRFEGPFIFHLLLSLLYWVIIFMFMDFRKWNQFKGDAKHG